MIKRMYRLAIASAFIVYTIWGFTFLASTRCQEYTSPLVLLMYRFDISALVMLLPAVFGLASISLKGKKIGLVLLTGLMEPVLYFIGEQYGLKYTNSSFTGVSIAVIPVVTMLLAFIFLKEQPTKLQWLFSAVSIAGVIAVTVATSSFDGAISLKGVLLLLISILCGACCGIVSSMCSNEFSVYERTLIMQLMGAVFYTLLAFIECRHDMSALIEPITQKGFVIPMLFLALGASAAAYTLFNFAVSYAPVTNIINVCNLTTVISVAAGVLVLKEPFSLTILFGTVAVLVGIWGVQKFSRRV